MLLFEYIRESEGRIKDVGFLKEEIVKTDHFQDIVKKISKKKQGEDLTISVNKALDNQFQDYRRNATSYSYNDLFIEYIKEKLGSRREFLTLRYRVAYDEISGAEDPFGKNYITELIKEEGFDISSIGVSQSGLSGYFLDDETNREVAIRSVNRYCGNYHIFRYAAQITEGPRDGPEGSLDSRVVRAAMQISEREGNFPRFEIVFRPRDDANRVVGEVFSVGEHLYLVGVEKRRGNPVFMIANYTKDVIPRKINAIVMRKHEKTDIISSRFLIVQAQQEDFIKMSEDAKILYESCVPEVISQWGEEMRNNIDHDGKASLIM